MTTTAMMMTPRTVYDVLYWNYAMEFFAVRMKRTKMCIELQHLSVQRASDENITGDGNTKSVSWILRRKRSQLICVCPPLSQSSFPYAQQATPINTKFQFLISTQKHFFVFSSEARHTERCCALIQILVLFFPTAKISIAKF